MAMASPGNHKAQSGKEAIRDDLVEEFNQNRVDQEGNNAPTRPYDFNDVSHAVYAFHSPSNRLELCQPSTDLDQPIVCNVPESRDFHTIKIQIAKGRWLSDKEEQLCARCHLGDQLKKGCTVEEICRKLKDVAQNDQDLFKFFLRDNMDDKFVLENIYARQKLLADEAVPQFFDTDFEDAEIRPPSVASFDGY